MSNLPTIVRDYRALEAAVKPLVDAANTENWRPALNLLYMNGSVMSFPQVSLPVLVGLNGAEEDVKMSMDLLQGKAKTALAPLVSNLARLFVPRILSMVQKTEFVDAVSKGQEESVMLLFVSNIGHEIESHMNELTKMFVEGAFTLSELISIGVFKALCDLRKDQIRAGLSENEYDEMVELLIGLNVVEPRLQVSVCPLCANYQFTISRYSPYSDKCPKCGCEWTTATLYTLEPSLAKMKGENADLAVFASAYLRNRLTYSAPTEDVEVYPNAVTNVNDHEVEVDVYLPQFNIGLECKVFEDALAPLTKNRLGSIVGGLSRQVEGFSSIGIENVVVVTNLPQESAVRLGQELQKDVQQRSMKITNLVVVQGNVDALIQMLDTLSSSIAKQVGEKLSEMVKKVALKDETNEKTHEILKSTEVEPDKSHKKEELKEKEEFTS